MQRCIYCDKEKLDSELTLEHAIPRFLGGAFAPDRFKVKRVCAKCNTNLGIFVDGSFARTWFVSNWLSTAAQACYDPANPIGVPLVCMGPTELKPPGMGDDEVCELWLGPHGELVYWIRAKDERMYWYVGGNPITSKQRETSAYFLFTDKEDVDLEMTWLSFRDAFKDAHVKKVMCTNIRGTDPATIGFVTKSNLDEQRCQFFYNESVGRGSKIRLSINTKYDLRFMSKLALGIGYVLYGERLLEAPYAAELRKGIWHREGDPDPMVRGTTSLHEHSNDIMNVTGRPDAVVITIIKLAEGVGINLNISRQLNWTVMCAKSDVYDSVHKRGGDDEVLVLFPFLQRCVQTTLVGLLNHHKGRLHPDLADIESRLKNNMERRKRKMNR